MSFFARIVGKNPRIPLSKIPRDATPIFQTTPPWWARWVLVIVAVDTMVTTSMMELTWFHWGTMEPKEKSPNDTSIGDSEELEFVPRPYSLRSVTCFMHFATGCGVAGALLATRSRIIRSIHLVKPVRSKANAKPQQRVLVETASMPFGQAAVTPVAPSKIIIGNNKAQLQLQTPNHGRWLMDLRGSKVMNTPATGKIDEARETFLAAWKKMNGQIIIPKPPKQVAVAAK